MTASFRSKSTGNSVVRGLASAAAYAVLLTTAMPLAAQQAATPSAAARPQAPPPAAAARASDPVVPADYVIGNDDVLSIVFWKDKEMSSDVQVRPDGKIAVPLINEVQAAGLTPEQLRLKLVEESKKYMEDASITIVVRQINSRRVFVVGEVFKPGPYALTTATTVLQLLATAGGLREYANAKNIRIMRTENGKQVSFKFNYRDVSNGKNLNQNIELKPGDTVIVP